MKKYLLPTTALGVALALVLLAPAIAFSQNPASGALLTITGTAGAAPVNLKIYDSQIHTGVVQVPPQNSAGSTVPCGPGDEIPTDAYVLQGGSATGCDPGDAFETAQQPGHATLENFAITTAYCIVGGGEGETSCANVGTGTGCNSSVTLCANPDTGFLTVTNTGGSTFTGTISLTGTSPIAGGGHCPTNGLASDSWTQGLASGQSVTLALGTSTPGSAVGSDSSNCGGFNQEQTQQLTYGVASTFLFGNDLYVFTPTSALTGADFLSFKPAPVPTGFTQGTVPLFPSPLDFNPGPMFPSFKGIPFADFSAPGNPVTPELQLDCSGPDCGNILYASEVGYDIDNSSIPSGLVGGPGLIGDHSDECVTSNFSFNTIVAFTSPDVPPLTKGGGRGNSCFGVTWDPTQPVIPPNTTISTFFGFEFPLSDTTVNPITRVPDLKWDSFDSNGKGISNLQLCTAVNANGTCATPGVTAPWVHLSLVPIANCPAKFTGLDPLPGTFINWSIKYQRKTPGEYTFLWNATTKSQQGLEGCQVSVELQFDTGTYVNPATFQYESELY